MAARPWRMRNTCSARCPASWWRPPCVAVAARQGSARPAAGAELPPFVGRSRELVLLERHLAGEGPPLLLLAGEPGIGKSRLLQEAEQRAGAHGLCALAGRCQHRGDETPYAPLLPALARHLQAQAPAQLRADLRGCAWLVCLLPELAGGPIEPLPAWTLPPEQERRLLFAAVAQYLRNVAGPAGTLLLLDDLQWAGPDALALLASLLHADAPLRVIGAYRDTVVQPEDALVAALEGACQARLLEEEPEGYRFAHDVIREVVEGQLSEGRRLLLHRRVAEVLEAGEGEPPVELLAYHYSRSDVHDKAVHYLEQAGDHAQAQLAHAAAEGYYRELVERLERLGRPRDAACGR